MSDDAIGMVWVVGILAFGAGLVWTGAEYGLAVAAAVASVVLTSAWAVAVILLLLKILDRLPAAKKEAADPARGKIEQVGKLVRSERGLHRRIEAPGAVQPRPQAVRQNAAVLARA
jgi:hypothetical protein